MILHRPIGAIFSLLHPDIHLTLTTSKKIAWNNGIMGQSPYTQVQLNKSVLIIVEPTVGNYYPSVEDYELTLVSRNQFYIPNFQIL